MGVEITLAGLLTMRGVDGVARHLASAQARVVLVRLTLERDQGTTRDELADAVWSHRLPRTWDSALRTLISRVRAFVALALPSGVDPLVSQGGRYRLCLPDDAVVDVEQAEHAVAAAQQAMAVHDVATARRSAADGLSRLRAPLLPEHEGPWVRGVRDQLTELLVTACEIASEACVGLDDTAQALTFANEAVVHAPLRESAHRCRMTAQAAAGNRAEALRTYQRLRRVLAEELGVDPSPETEAAYLELLGPASSVGESSRPGPRHTEQPPFVGREGELATLAAAWREAVGGIRQLLSVSGEAGIGKTRLVMEAARAVAADGGLVLFGRCDRDAVTSYQPFMEALDGYVAAAPADELPRLGPSQHEAAAALLPSFPDRRPPPDYVPERTTLFDAVTKLLVGAARERPTLVVLDDLQWADRGTALLLRHVLRRSRGTRLLVVAVSRDDIRGPHPLTDVVRALDCDGWLHRLHLPGLDEWEVTSLLKQVAHVRRAVIGEPEAPQAIGRLVRDLLAESAGNPLILLELLRWFDPSGPTAAGVGSDMLPAGVHDLLADKLAALGPAPTALLRAAAIAGSPFELDVVAAAAGLDELAALDALDAVLAAGLLVDAVATADLDPDDEGEADGLGEAPADDGRYRFAHGVVRRALLAQMSGARRRFLVARLSAAALVVAV
jgi:DNA-binding SARP family transcriptional activator